MIGGVVNQKNPNRQNNFIERIEEVDDIDDNDSHPIQGKSDLEHKTDRLILDNLIDVIDNNTD